MADEIRDLGHDAYLINGEVIWVQENAVDPSTEDGRDFLIGCAEDMKSGDPFVFHRACGRLTLMLLYPKCVGPFGFCHTMGPGHYNMLPDDCRMILKEVFPEYATEI